MEFENGKIISGSFLIEKITSSKNIVEIELNNGTTKIQSFIKHNADIFIKTYVVGDKIFCKGKVIKRRKKVYLDLIYISKGTNTPITLPKDNQFNIDFYIKRFEEIVNDIKDPDYRLIIDNCFNNDFKELFFTYPAAKKHHHNYTHGLLQHTIEVVDISLFLANFVKDLNIDLLLCASLLHDIGKLKAYDVDENLEITRTDWGHLLGHLSISALFVSKIVPPDIDSKKIMILYHMILSHHGKHQWGSPVEYKMKEAYILHMADMLSAELNGFNVLKYINSWSETNASNRTWFKGC
jgi:3'-5' exoribonuclease